MVEVCHEVNMIELPLMLDVVVSRCIERKEEMLPSGSRLQSAFLNLRAGGDGREITFCYLFFDLTESALAKRSSSVRRRRKSEIYESKEVTVFFSYHK